MSFFAHLGIGHETHLFIISVQNIMKPAGIAGTITGIHAHDIAGSLIMRPGNISFQDLRVVVFLVCEAADFEHLQRFIQGGDFLLFLLRGVIQHGRNFPVSVA